MTAPDSQPDRDPDQRDSGKSVPRVNSQDLLRDRRRVIIAHRGEEYVLQVTRAGRLILTK